MYSVQGVSGFTEEAVTALLGDIDQDCVSSLGNLDVCHIETLGFESGIILPGLGQKERSLPVTNSKIVNFHQTAN